MTASQSRSLGDYFWGYEFPEEERARVAAAAASGGIPATILLKYAAQTDPYKERFVRSEAIPGFRQGSKEYNKHAPRRIIQYLNDADSPNYKLCWKIYRRAALKYVINDLPPLNTLFVQVPAPNSDSDVVDAFRLICSNAMAFGVPKEQVKTFYELWGVKRIDNVDSLLNLCLQGDEASVQKRQIANVISDVALLADKVSDISSLVSSQQELLAEHAEATADLTATLKAATDKAVSAASKSVKESLSQLSSNTDSRLNEVDRRLQALAATIAKTAGRDQTPLKALKSEVDKAAKQIRHELTTTKDSIAATIELRLTDFRKEFDQLATNVQMGIAGYRKEIETRVAAKLNETLSATASSVETRLTAIQDRLGSQEQTRSAPPIVREQSRYQSPFQGVATTAAAHFALTSELSFVDSWRAYVSSTHDLPLTFEQALLFHRAFLANDVLVADEILASSWLKCLRWESFTLHLAASPAWSYEEDWAAGPEHLSETGGPTQPRVVVIHNYDIAVVDCYLTPTLLLWRVQRQSKQAGLTKLFLVPSSCRSEQVVDAAFHIPDATAPLPYKLLLKPGTKPATAPANHQFGVDPAVAVRWLDVPQVNVADFDRIRKALSFRLSATLVEATQRTIKFAGKYFLERSAADAALHYQVLPSVKAAYSDAGCGELTALLARKGL